MDGQSMKGGVATCGGNDRGTLGDGAHVLVPEGDLEERGPGLFTRTYERCLG